DETVIILLDNSGSGSLGEMSHKLAAIIYDKPYQLPEVLNEIKVEDSILRSYVGAYELQPGFIITISFEKGALMAQATGQPKFELHAQTNTLFFLREVEAKLEFVPGAQGKPTQLILHQGGRDMPGKRVN
ncbi:MAG TPA: DUF3471 domain-containing protein, partial [Puia sp.]|nr:DUF3471 domain-containing protein [Puia sp.]